MSTKRDSRGRRRHPNQALGRAGFPAAGDGGAGLKCPSYLGADGRAAWTEARDHLREAGILDSGDAKALELFAAAYEEFRIYRKAAIEHGPTVEVPGSTGGPVRKANPAIAAVASAHRRCEAMLGALGIGAKARATLGISKGEEELDPFEALLRS